MVITSCTQWTIPLAGGSTTITVSSSSSSSQAAAPVSVTKNGSMLGLKTCHLSAPENQQELRSSSSRRLQDALLGADRTLSNRRSAGSFRQLINEELSSWDYTKQHHEDGHEYENCQYDGIAIPAWTSVQHCNGFLNHNTKAQAMVKVGHGLVYDDGEITADDVDLLPMPGPLMSSLASPLMYDGSIFPSYNVAMPKTNISSSESSALKSSKSKGAAGMASDYSGLPLPPGNEYVNAAASEEFKDEDVCRTMQTAILNGKDNEAFADSLASLWSNELYPPHNMLRNDPESLASIFNVFPQNFHGFSVSAEPHISSCVENGSTVVMSNFSIDNDLHVLIGSGDKTSQAAYKAITSSDKPSAGTCNVKEREGSGIDMMLKKGAPISATVDRVPVTASSHGVRASDHVPETSHGGNVTKISSLLLPDADTASCVIQMEKQSGGFKDAKRSFSMLQAQFTQAIPTASSCSTVANSWKSPQDYVTARYNVSSLEEELIALKPPPVKLRRRHGTAMDPQSIAARSRREKFSERIRILQSLVPNGERLDTVSMLGQTLEYVRFLQHQVWQLYHGKEPDNVTCEKWKDFVEAAPASAG